MSQPYFGAGEPEATTTVTPPPDEDSQVQQIVKILLAAYAINRTAAMLHAVFPGIDEAVWRAVIKVTGGMSGHRANAKLTSMGLRGGVGERVARSAAKREIVYRAAYLRSASHRVQIDVNEGDSLAQALKIEVRAFHMHEAARRGRLEAASRVGLAANMFGELLGWYLDPLLNNEPECIAANGNNFYADESTVIGDPGAVHLNCGCSAGPPHEGAGLVNDAIHAARTVIFAQPRKYSIKKAS